MLSWRMSLVLHSMESLQEELGGLLTWQHILDILED
jgi:hypothetical protein